MATFVGALFLVVTFWAGTGEAGLHDSSWATVCQSVGGQWVEENRTVGECVAKD